MPRKFLILSMLIAGCATAGFYYLNAESPEQARERYLAKGAHYVNDGKVPEAVIMFKNAIQVDPNSAEARYELGLALIRGRDFPQAFAELRRAVELQPNFVKARHQLGSLYLLDRNKSGAIEQLAKIREQDPNAVEGRFLAAALALTENDFDKALKEIEEAVSRAEKEKHPNLGDLYVELGKIHQRKRDWREAELAYRKSLELDGKLLRAREGLAAIYMANGDEAKARQELVTARHADPENENAWHSLGKFYLKTKRLDEFESLYRELLTKKPQSMIAMKKLAEIMLSKGDIKGAKIYTDDILKAESGDIDGLLFRGRIKLSERDFDKAQEDLSKVVTGSSKFAPAFYFLALAQIGLGDVAQARGSLLKSLELSPNAPEPRLTLAEIYLNSGDLEAATVQSDKVLRLLPENLTALLINGAAELKKGDAGKAIAFLKKAQTLYPKDARTYLLLGTASMMQKNSAQALKEFEGSLNLDPDRLETLSSIALTMVQQGNRKAAMERVEKHLGRTQMPAGVYQLLGQLSLEAKEFDNGIQHLRRAIEIQPDLSSAYFLIGQAYLAQNKVDQSIEEYQKVVKNNPRDPRALTILGSMYDHKEEYARANDLYEQALKSNGNFAPAANNLAWNYAEHGGNLDLALPLAQKARERNPDSPQILDTLGWIYYKKGLYDNAVALLKESSEKLENREPTVLYHLGMAYHRTGRKVEARDALNKALALNKNFPGTNEARKTLSEPAGR